MPLRGSSIAAALAVAVVLATAPAAGASPPLQAGVGRADITPPTGYYMQGWVRSDAKTTGQHTRLWARVIVLKRGARKVALVAEDLNGIAGGMLVDAAHLVRARGFSERNVLDSASHTHAAQGQYFNFGTYNTVFMTAQTPTQFNTAADPQLYTFMVRRLALAIRRADDNLGPAALGWGHRELLGITRNRSLEAHLADHGIIEPPGSGSVAQDPLGYRHTIDPAVTVLRVDKVGRGGRRMPIGIWSTFADHGTVNKYTFHFYNEDHHGAATHVVEDVIRRTGHVPRGQAVVNAYGNTDEGDQSAGLDRSGPAAADFVGRAEARSMLAAWRSAGAHMTRRPSLGLRWTRVCFCGQNTDIGPVDNKAVVGFPLLTGSEEGRGPLYDQTHVSHEGKALPVGAGSQGDKIPVVVSNDTPKAVPLMVLRVGDKLIASIPGEMTVEMGRRVRSAVLAASAGAGIHSVVISGLANEYLSYFTTPEEYDRQHYEGGSTMYGRASSEVLKLTLVDLAKALAHGKAAPVPYAYDPRNGLAPDKGPFPKGASSGHAIGQPGETQRLARAVFRWHGGPRGEDRRLDRAFVTVQRHTRRYGWHDIDSDLGLHVLWDVDSNDNYRALWEIPVEQPLGKYRFVVTANRYRLVSHAFRVLRSSRLSIDRAASGGGSVTVRVDYPRAIPEKDLSYRPNAIDGGRVTFVAGARRFVARRRHGGRFSAHVPAGKVVVLPGGALDRFGNANGSAFVIPG